MSFLKFFHSLFANNSNSKIDVLPKQNEKKEDIPNDSLDLKSICNDALKESAQEMCNISRSEAEKLVNSIDFSYDEDECVEKKVHFETDSYTYLFEEDPYFIHYEEYNALEDELNAICIKNNVELTMNVNVHRTSKYKYYYDVSIDCPDSIRNEAQAICDKHAIKTVVRIKKEYRDDEDFLPQIEK